MLCWIKLINIRIEDIERIGIPKCTHVLALGLGNGIAAEAAGQPRTGGGIEIPANGVGALLIEYISRGYDVADMLAHFLAVLVAYKAEDNAVLECGLIEQYCRQRTKRIEPAPGLIYCLTDIIRRETALKFFFIFKGIMPLCKWHGAAVKPAVYDHGFTLHGSAALFTPECYRVEHGLMKLYILRNLGRIAPKLRTAPHHMIMSAVGTHPHGQRSTPIALTADSPVDHVLKEIAHASLAYGLGYPVDLLIVLNHTLPNGGRLDEPALPCIIDKRSITAPAEGIAVLVGKLLKKPSAASQILDYGFISLFDEDSIPWSAACKLALGAYKLYKR